MYAAAIFLPLAAAAIAGFLGRFIGDMAAMVTTCVGVGLSALISIVIFFDVALGGQVRSVELFNWIQSGSFEAVWSLRFDSLSAVMLIVVTFVSTAVHVYAIGYMAHEEGKPRFFAYLSLFTFAMLMLVTADNLLQLFFGWEGVGLCSYLLIGFWYDRPSANAAAIKAFVVNRVGDFGFALGIMGTYLLFDSVAFDAIFPAVPHYVNERLHFLGMDLPALEVLCVLLFIGAMGKSAQLGLHTWLPDAMEGPTPVSALIHAATMVTAGVFMVCRLSPMFEYAETALAIVAIVGASTAIFAATIGLTQTDIKRVIAYSTCSQLGYMFFAAGVSAYPAAMFHLTTHAFFKALLFLGSGSVIHAMSGEQDMRHMGGIWRMVGLTYGLMWIGSLALIGVPFFAGYYSKDMVLEAAWGAGTGVGAFAFWLGLAAAVMTAFYSARLLFMTFHGTPRADAKVMAHVHESPPVMTYPLIFLAIGAVISGAIGYEQFVGHHWTEFWGNSILVLPAHGAMEVAHHAPLVIKLLPVLAGLVGLALGYQMYIRAPGAPRALARMLPFFYRLSFNKWYFDELYDWLLVRPARKLGYGFWKSGDGALIDGVGPDAIAALTQNLARRASLLQTGYLYHYAFAMLIGVVALVSWYMYAAG